MEAILMGHRQQVIANIAKGFSNFNASVETEDDTLEKGDILNNFSNTYGNNKPLTFKKTGKWLKENLPAVVTRLTILQTDFTAKMAVLKEKAGCEPDEPYTSYNMKSVQLMRYGWNVCYPREVDGFNRQVESVETEESKACKAYNDMCYGLMNVMEDIACCNVIINGVDDKASYELTISQLVALGFQDAISKGEVDDFEIEGTDEQDADALLTKSIEGENDKKKVSDELEKAEGDRGGQILGHTKSGKPIYAGDKVHHAMYGHGTVEGHSEHSHKGEKLLMVKKRHKAGEYTHYEVGSGNVVHADEVEKKTKKKD